MKWDRSTTLPLARAQCAQCGGSGLIRYRGDGQFLRDGSKGGQWAEEQQVPCACVLRAIFRICFARFEDCQDKLRIKAPLLERKGKASRFAYGRRDEEYSADFCLISRRTLRNREYDIFRFYFLLGMDSEAVAKRVKLSMGNLYHELYRVEGKLGHAFATTKPYGLYPLDEYFGGSTRVHVDDLHKSRGTQ